MVNGRVSLIIYIGAWVSIILCIVGFIVLAATGHDSPPELQVAMTAAFGIIAGSHIMPPITRKATENTLGKVEHDLKRRSTDV